MKAEQLLRKEAIRFLKHQAPLAFMALSVGVIGITFILHGEGVPMVRYWAVGALTLHLFSLVMRHFNKEIFVTELRRERFGIIANFLESCVTGSSLWFISQASAGAGVFVATILLVHAVGCAITSAGYKPFMWSFSGPLLFFQVLALGDCFVNTGADIYAAAAFVSLSSFILLSLFSDRSREMILSLINSQLEAQRAVQSKTRFFISSSHDLRQPVAAASAYVSSALKVATDESLRANLHSAKAAIKLIDEQITPIMELARIDSGDTQVKLQDFDLNKTLLSTATMFRPLLNAGTELILKLPESVSTVRSDPALLTRVITNILDNSIKYTESGKISVVLEASRSSFTLTVKDTGIGIAKSQLELIFDEFYQVNNPDRDIAKGYGLGLSIAQRLCNKLGIDFMLESEHGQHTTATLKTFKHGSKA